MQDELGREYGPLHDEVAPSQPEGSRDGRSGFRRPRLASWVCIEARRVRASYLGVHAEVLGIGYEWGIATECVTDTELEAATDRLVKELRGFPPLAQRTAKKLLNDIEDANLTLAIELEGQAYGRLRCSDDFREGVEAFHQKRRPKFTGR
jgi:1,4-dihydroxy-2-naphthoyl-CoA synthase